MQNLAGQPHDVVDSACDFELSHAHITVHKLPEILRSSGEVAAAIMGELHGWQFKRAWYYWVAEGPGLPYATAVDLYSTNPRDVRADGHCGCIHPKESANGLGVGLYHVDSVDGLVALANAIRSVVAQVENPAEDLAVVNVRLQATIADLQLQLDAANAQIKTLMSDENSWQSGYNRGRAVATSFYQTQVKDAEAYAERIRERAGNGG